MYAVIRRYEDVSSVDEVMHRIEAGWAPLIRQAPGLIAYYAVDAGGAAASISLFEDRAQAEDSVRRAADWVREQLGSLSPNPAQVTTGEVRVQVARERVSA
jgi:hypothetical protein